MKIDWNIFNTSPLKEDEFWQIVIFPTITVLRSRENRKGYTIVSFEWLFWSLSTMIK